jgi:hypothetical protein
VLLHVDERSLKVSSLLAGRPDEQHDVVHRLLLHRNQRPAPVHFAIDDEGDLLLVGRVPLGHARRGGARRAARAWCSRWPTTCSTVC